MTSQPHDALNTVIARAEGAGATVGVSARLATGERVSHNGGRRFVAASTVKIPIMVELFRQVDAGTLRLDTVHAVQPAEKAGGSGVVARLHDGIGLTLSDLAFLMMSISDNTATNILIERLGLDRVNGTMGMLGMAGSNLSHAMRGRHVVAGEPENWAVPDDYAGAVAALLEGRAAASASCAAMLDLLSQQQNDRRIARHLPRQDRPRWGSKTGSLPGVANDVGFVTTARGPVILAVFVEGMDDAHGAEQVIGDVARAVLAAAA